MYFYSLIYTQLKFFNLSADYPLAKMWSLPPLSTTIGGKVKKPIRRNQPSLFMKISASLLDS